MNQDKPIVYEAIAEASRFKDPIGYFYSVDKAKRICDNYYHTKLIWNDSGKYITGDFQSGGRAASIKQIKIQE